MRIGPQGGGSPWTVKDWLLFSLALLLMYPSVCTAATPRPGTWDVIANGFQGRLNIASIDAQGNLFGTVGGRNPNKPNPRLLG